MKKINVSKEYTSDTRAPRRLTLPQQRHGVGIVGLGKLGAQIGGNLIARGHCVSGYTEGALYQLYAAPEQVSDIALQKGEKIVAVSAGDTLRWVVGDTVSGTGSETI